MKHLLTRRRVLAAVAAGVAVGVGASYAVAAATRASSPTLVACVNDTNGLTRIVPSASECRSSEHVTLLAAAGGGTTFTTVTDSAAIPPAVDGGGLTVHCPAGATVVSGGGRVAAGGDASVTLTSDWVRNSYPDSASSWTFTVQAPPANFDGQAKQIVAYAVCAP